METKFNCLYEDKQIIVVQKPQNMPSQGDSSGDGNLLDLIKAYIKEKDNKPGNVFLGLVHRLDRPTGGVMVFAKTSKSAERLCEQFKTDEVHKRYFAVVVGCPREKRGRLVHFLKKDERNNMVTIVPASTVGAKRAELTYEVLDTEKGFSLVEINLITGRSHQARVQMAALGTPIYGDVKYGGNKTPKAMLNLYAVELHFDHPVTKEHMRFICYPPEDRPMWNLFKIDRYLMIK